MSSICRKIVHAWVVVVVAILPCSNVHAQNADIDLLKDINVSRNKGLDGTMKVFSASVFPLALGVPATAVVTGYLKHDKVLMEQGVQTIAGLGLTSVITLGLKYSVQRSRPYVTYPAIEAYSTEATPSFPSSHTSVAFSLATSVSLNVRKWYVTVPAYAWAGTAAYSRMHLGVHYPSDVVVGAIVGAGSAWLVYKGNMWLHKRKSNANDLPHELIAK